MSDAINVKISANGSELRRDVTEDEKSIIGFAEATDRATKALDRFQKQKSKGARPSEGDQLTSGITAAGGALLSMSGLGMFAGFATAAGTVGLLKDRMGELADKAKEFTNESAKLGVSTEEYQRLKYAVEKTGGSAEQLTMAFSKIAISIKSPTEETTKALSKLNLSVSDFSGMSPDQAFSKMAAAISMIPDPMTRAAIAAKLFGESGAKLIPMMQDLEKLKSKAMVISDQDLKNVKEMVASLKSLGRLAGYGVDVAVAKIAGVHKMAALSNTDETVLEKSARESEDFEAKKVEASKKAQDKIDAILAQGADFNARLKDKQAEDHIKQLDQEKANEEKNIKEMIELYTKASDKWESEEDKREEMQLEYNEKVIAAKKRVAEEEQKIDADATRQKMANAERLASAQVDAARKASDAANAAFEAANAAAKNAGGIQGAGADKALFDMGPRERADRRRQLMEDERLHKKRQDIEAGKNVFLTPREQRRLDELTRQESDAKKKQDAAKKALEDAEKGKEKAAGALVAFDKSERLKTMDKSLIEAKYSLKNIEKNLRIVQ